MNRVLKFERLRRQAVPCRRNLIHGLWLMNQEKVPTIVIPAFAGMTGRTDFPTFYQAIMIDNSRMD